MSLYHRKSGLKVQYFDSEHTLPFFMKIGLNLPPIITYAESSSSLFFKHVFVNGTTSPKGIFPREKQSS